MSAPGVKDNFWVAHKRKETEKLILACAGLWMEASAKEYSGVPSKPVNLNVQIIKRNNADVRLEEIGFWSSADTLVHLDLKTNELMSFKHTEVIPISQPWSNPYWLNEKHEVNRFVVKDKELIGKPENDPALTVVFRLTINATPLLITRPVVYKYTDDVKGEIYRPFEILPPATVNISDKVYVFTDATPKTVEFVIRANAPDIQGSLELKAPEGWTISLMNPEVNLAHKGDEMTVLALISPGKDAANGQLKAALKIKGILYSKSIRRIEYDHIPYQFILNDAEAGLVNINLKKTGTTIGYIPGAGDDIPSCLRQIGYTVTELTDEILSSQNLSKYSAIITGVRAYNTNKRMPAYYDKLMEYVHNGGNLVVQYNTNNQLGWVSSKIGPYPFNISRERVTDEKAEVVFLKAGHPALNTPNKISSADFEGWIQERGIYFATASDKNYESIFSMHDPGDKASEGSLIIGKYGKGNFVYTGLVFFRELPAGVPGAYRLLVNLLSLPPNN